MPTKTVTYQEDDYDVTLVVRQATRRDRIHYDALRFGDGTDYPLETAEDRLYALHARDMYAACMAVTEIGGLEVETSEQFLDLPDALVDPWCEAVVELNPHWFPFLRTPTSAPESTENSAAGS